MKTIPIVEKSIDKERRIEEVDDDYCFINILQHISFSKFLTERSFCRLSPELFTKLFEIILM